MKKLLALLLCVVMVVGVMSTAAFAAGDITTNEDLLELVGDQIAGVQEYGVALAIYAKLDEVAAEFYDQGYYWTVDGVKITAEAYRDQMFENFKTKFQELFTGKTFNADDLDAYVDAATEAYEYVGTLFIGDMTIVALHDLKEDMFKSFEEMGIEDVDAVLTWFEGLPS